MAQSVELRQPTTTFLIMDATGAPVVDLAQFERSDEWRTVVAIANDQPDTLYRLMYVRWIKPTAEWLMAFMLLLFCAPIMLLIVVALLVTTGRPVFFRQQRVGRDGRLFTVLKFRTMIADRRSDRDGWDGIERRQRHKTETDPRVTSLGRLLRRTSLDELPQLLNVLRGDMALVGPRPELPKIVMAYEPWQHQRHLVRPGITGWWQVNGRSDRPMHEHTELDLYYIEHLSFAMDVRILLRTFRAVLSRSGAF